MDELYNFGSKIFDMAMCHHITSHNLHYTLSIISHNLCYTPSNTHIFKCDKIAYWKRKSKTLIWDIQEEG